MWSSRRRLLLSALYDFLSPLRIWLLILVDITGPSFGAGYNGLWGFGSVVKSSPANARDVCLFPGLGRSPGEENGSLLQYSCLGNSMNRGVWWATVHGVSKSRTWHKDWVHMHTMTCPFMAVLPHYQSYFFKALNKSHIWAHPNEAWDWMKRQQGALYICLFSSMLAIL